MQDLKFVIQKSTPTISKTFRIPVKTAEILEKLAKENHISMNALVIQCIIFALENRQDEHFHP
ncbi:MAG: hypothetical protein V3G42_05830 [Oscillospiraceae bacterium]